MQQKMASLKRWMALAIIVQAALLVIFRMGLDKGIMSATVILIAEAAALYFCFDRFESMMENTSTGVRDVLGDAAKDAYLFGEIGMVFYDDSHIITWMSDLFDQRGINRVGRKILVWLPEAEPLLNGDTDRTKVQLDDRMYEITRKEDEQVLFFRDVTDLEHYQVSYDEERAVIGMASLDNYEESTQYEDESVVSAINVAVRSPLTDYCKDHGILCKRVNNYRYFLVLNEKIFSDISADHFSVLNTVRRAAQKQEVSITLSMAFARGIAKYTELDDTVARLMDLAQSRGGDQVAVQKAGEDVIYFGGSTEATEKRSRVRVRVMAHTFRELISRSSNVIICGHREMDFDCMGSAIGMARIAETLHKPSVIIAKTGGIEEKLNAALHANSKQLNEEVRFVTEGEALNQLQDNTLVIMVDHHSIKQSNGSKVLESAKKIAIVDHHRRTAEMGIKPVLVYIEAGASSGSELITELFPYVSNSLEISDIDATIMLAGMTIDTNRFRTRTGSRTFDAASSLRKLGADPLLVDEYLKDSYEEFNTKANAMADCRNIGRGVVICAVKDKVLTRSVMSQIADEILEIQSVEAAFVIANDSDDETAISARSNGKVNVQVIMEKMKGGGHMTAAAMQRPRCSVDALQKELQQNIEDYFKEAETDESNIDE
ncbi:MAG: DHH family phosphoesterase [Erysipelotrichia bacterium]|nr:DHH family phosphoesterase [Erysipelotrichia bacterium]